MKNFTLFITLIFTSFGFSQNSGELVVFSNLGDPFYVILNGEKQNMKAETNVKVQSLNPGFYSCKVLSENNLYSFDKNFEIKANFQTTFRIVEKSGVPKMRYFSETAMTGTHQATTGQTVVAYHPAPATNTTTTQTVQTTTTNETNTISNGVETINIGVQVSENGMGTTISGTDFGGQEGLNQTTTVTTTTTSTNTSGNNGNINQNHPTNNHCLVDNDGMTKVTSLIKAESFSDNKLNVAKQFTRNNCLTVDQIKQIGNLFSFSDDKMEYVKYAYDYCLNTNDYYELNEIFTFSDDKNTLNGFINSK